jgi:Fe-S cluster assembly protein SufD
MNIEHYQQEYNQLLAKRVQHEPLAVRQIRQQGFNSFMQQGFPSTQAEDWKYTNITPITKHKFKNTLTLQQDNISKKDLQAFLFNEDDTYQLVFVDGQFTPALSTLLDLKNGVILDSLLSVINKNFRAVESYLGKVARLDKQAFTALNTAFIQDGAAIVVPNNIILDKPIHLLFIVTQQEEPLHHVLRNLIVIGENSKPLSLSNMQILLLMFI